MKTSEENSFEKPWRDAFEKASLPPPPDLWSRIEEELPGNERRRTIAVLWGMPTYLASGIAALLLITVGAIYFLNLSESNDTAKLASETSTIISDTAPVNEPVATISPENPGVSESVRPAETMPQPVIAQNNAVETVAALAEPVDNTKRNAEQIVDYQESIARVEMPVSLAAVPTLPAEVSPKMADDLQKLQGRTFDAYGSSYTLNRPRLVGNVDDFITETTTIFAMNKPKSSSWMVGVISGLSPFKANVSANNLNSIAASSAADYAADKGNFAFQNSSNGGNSSQRIVPNASPVQQFNTGRAISFGVQAGKKLSKKFALLSGFRYLQGNAPIDNNVYTLHKQSGNVNSFYQDYLRNSSSLNNTIVGTEVTLQNQYEYLSVPMQLAYELPLSQKVSVQVAGGVSADMFLRNTLQGENTETASLNANNSIFRPVSFSGLGGVQLNYILDDKWELSLGSGVQQALVSNLRSTSDIKLRPQMFGINYGVNYHF